MTSKQSCGNCDAWLKQGVQGDGLCRAVPATPIMIGMGQTLLGGQPQPVVVSFFPQMHERGWCRAWQPSESLQQ